LPVMKLSSLGAIVVFVVWFGLNCLCSEVGSFLFNVEVAQVSFMRASNMADYDYDDDGPWDNNNQSQVSFMKHRTTDHDHSRCLCVCDQGDATIQLQSLRARVGHTTDMILKTHGYPKETFK